jgi:tetratricopeptide (TPR) repeat protein
VQLVAIRWQQGRLDELEPIVRTQVENNPLIPAWRCSLAYIYSEAGKAGEAQREFEELATSGFPIPRDAAWPIGMARLALTCSFLADEKRADVLLRLFEPYAGRNVVVGPGLSSAGAASRYLGLLAATMARWDDAERLFRDAIDQNQRMGARPFVAFTMYDYASMLQRRAAPGDLERANDLLDRALPIAHDVGMPVLEERITTARDKTPALD